MPTLGSKDLNLYRLFNIVQTLGGYNKVGHTHTPVQGRTYTYIRPKFLFLFWFTIFGYEKYALGGRKIKIIWNPDWVSL